MPRRWERSSSGAASVAVEPNEVVESVAPSSNKEVALGGYPGQHTVPRSAWASDQGTSKAGNSQSSREQLLSGYRVVLRDSRQGEIEFVATSGEGLVSLDDGRAKPRPRLEETQREWVEGLWPEQCWALPRDVRVTERQHRVRERRDVADYRHSLRCAEGRQQGLSSAHLACELGRPEQWVLDTWARGMLPKPKNLEHWDAAGFCEVRYIKGLYHKEGLYESIVQGVDWEQDRVWRVHKESDGQWGLRTVKQCQAPGCGRTLQRVPETAVKIGPRDSAGPSRTKVHSNWCCALKGASCMKADFGTPVGDAFYWWCPAHKWYVCQECQQDMADKPTSKQIRHWYRTECSDLDDLVYRVVRDFSLPDPQAAPGDTARYTIKMNWYPDGLAQVTDHRHDVWTILVSLGSPRVLNVDNARVLMEDGDAILFGTQKHGVPPGPPSQGGRLSLVLMFHPDPQVEDAALQLAGRAPTGSAPRRAKESPQTAPADMTAVAQEHVGELCAALGISAEEAVAALMECGGNVEMAAEMLLGA